MKFFKYLLFVVYLLYFQQLVADECKNFEDKVLSIPYPENGIVTDGQQPKFDLGIFFKQDFNYQTNETFIARDKNNYPIVKFSLSERKIKPSSTLPKCCSVLNKP